MAINIEMPKLSDTMSEGTVAKWHKSVGDSVEIGDVIAEIETDKATMEMEAFDDGTITEIKVDEGGKAAIGEVLAVLDGDGEGSDDSGSDEDSAEESSGAEASDDSGDSNDSHDSGDQKDSAAPAAPSKDGERIKASPLARKVAEELGVDLTQIEGSGPAGRIVKADVQAASKRGSSSGKSKEANAAEALASAAKSKSTADSPAPKPAAIAPVASGEDEKIELSTMRKVIAERLLTSKTTIPHFYLHLEVDAGPLMSLRKQVNEQAEKTHGNKYSVNDFVLKAVINAAQLVPAINASFAGDHIVKYADVGMSVAIAVEDGLVTPVIKKAQDQSLLQISKAVKDFAARARDNKLKPNEFDGGTITDLEGNAVTNNGVTVSSGYATFDGASNFQFNDPAIANYDTTDS
ncbi:MAG: dihydrolipoamide acetyltransferase family protein, partial [Akkermansiaceae bacterium]|nr:dihydrolipoamide acetyltransferase family protein [Akkermansiaceae bacterium]